MLNNLNTIIRFAVWSARFSIDAQLNISASDIALIYLTPQEYLE